MTAPRRAPLPASPRALLPRALAFFGLLWLMAIAWQFRDGAYSSEFGGHPDEAAHVVTGLMVRDYVASGFPGSPLAYAQQYYEHYPKIGLGVWPPLFYLVQTAWTLPFGPGRDSLLLLLAGLAAGVGVLLYRALREEVGEGIAAGAALALLSLPLVRELYSMVMAETLSALLLFAATLLFGQFLEKPRTRTGLAFGLLAAAAILTKGTGLALALMVPLALVASRQWRLWRHPGLWGGALVTALLAGPWTWKFRALGQGGWLQPSPSWRFTGEALPYYAGKLVSGLGPGLLVLALAGLWFLLRQPPALRGRWWAAGSLVVAIVGFQSLAPVGLEARHLVPALPACLLFAAYGMAQLSQKAPARVRRPALLLFLLVAALLPQPHFKHTAGFRPLARLIRPQLTPGETVLVSSDASGEGMFISELALLDPRRPGYTVLRASKALATSEWSGRDYHPKFGDEATLLAWLQSAHLRFLVVDDSVPAGRRLPHGAQLQALLERHPREFPHLATYRIDRGSEVGIARLYRVESALPSAPPG